MDLSNLSTPALILDHRILARNLEAVTARTWRRPQAPSKDCQVGRRGAPGAGRKHRGVTVSILHEDAFFLENGITDITYAVATAPGKLDAVALLDKGVNLKIFTDNVEVAHAIASHEAPEGPHRN